MDERDVPPEMRRAELVRRVTREGDLESVDDIDELLVGLCEQVYGNSEATNDLRDDIDTVTGRR